MTIKTSRGETYPVKWAWELTPETKLMMELEDRRRLPEIAEAFDGITRFERTSANRGNAVYDGYSRLIGIVRTEYGTVQMTFAKEV